MKKGVKIALISVGGFFVALGVFLVIWFCGASYPHFDEIAREEFTIPGMDEKGVPQGLTALPENAEGYDFAMSCYMADDSPSRIYLIDADTDTSKYITVTKNGKADTSHFGGVACSENYLMATSGKNILRISLSDALSAENGESIEITDSFNTGLRASFCYYDSGKLYAGEFYDKGKYDTPEEHHVTVANGEVNHGFVYVFDCDEEAEGGVVDAIPDQIISIRDKVQGFAIYEDGIVLSTSYGLTDSRIFCYPNVLKEEADDTFTLDGKEIPFYVLDTDNLRKEIVGPSMSEEPCVKDGRLYLVFESKCVKYKYFNRVRMENAISIALEDLD